MSEGNQEVLPDPGGQVTDADRPNPDGQNVSKNFVRSPILIANVDANRGLNLFLRSLD